MRKTGRDDGSGICRRKSNSGTVGMETKQSNRVLQSWENLRSGTRQKGCPWRIPIDALKPDEKEGRKAK